MLIYFNNSTEWYCTLNSRKEEQRWGEVEREREI